MPKSSHRKNETSHGSKSHSSKDSDNSNMSNTSSPTQQSRNPTNSEKLHNPTNTEQSHNPKNPPHLDQSHRKSANSTNQQRSTLPGIHPLTNNSTPNSSPTLNNQVEHEQLLENLYELLHIAKKYYDLDLSNQPLLKPIVCFLGSQSSGKSSIINYLFNNIPVRDVGPHAIDTHFTIIEVVSEKDFLQLCGNSTPNSHDPDDKYWLWKPRDPMSPTDDRDGIVWKDLTPQQASERYRQFYHSHLGEILRTHQLIKAVVVNEKYIQPTELQTDSNGLPISRDVIFIDTPGFNDESVGDVNKFKAYVSILEFFYRQSVYSFFVTDPENLRSIGNALHMLELMIADTETRNRIFEMAEKEIADRANNTSMSQGNSPFSVTTLIVDIAYNALSRKIGPLLSSQAQSSSNQSLNHNEYQYIGSSLYEKLYFIINKADKIRNLNYAFFELGLSLGRQFKYFPLPHASKILAIGIPHEQRLHAFRYGFERQKSEQERRKTFKKMMKTFTTDGLVHESITVGQLSDLESILTRLRGKDTIARCILFYTDYVYKSIVQVRERPDQGYFGRTFQRILHSKAQPYTRASEIHKNMFKLVPEDGK